MKEKFLALGGKIETNCEVLDLEIEDKEVKKAVCSNGKTFTADYFIAAIDANFFYEKLLKGKYPDPQFQKRFENPEDYPVPSELRISIGYEGVPNNIPRTIRFPVSSPFKINGNIIDRLQLTNYDYEPDFSPEGKTLFSVTINQFNSDYDAWDELYNNKGNYRKEKDRIGEEVVKAIETRFPEMKGKLKVLDIATPKTFERYCNSYRGGIIAFSPTLKGKSMDHSGYVRGLKNIQLSGQWLQGTGGLPPALITGKASIMRICKKEKLEFVQ